MRVSISALAVILLAGCGPVPRTSPSASPSNSPSSSPAAVAQVAACAVGEWLTKDGGLAGGGGTISGGQGVLVKISPTGATEIDFSAMQPAKFSATTSGTVATGTFVYFGTATGQIRTGDTTSLQGTWELAGKADFSNVKITADLTAPVAARIFDKVPLTSYNGPGATQTAGVIDAAPLLGKGNYVCGSSTLTLSPAGNTGLTWSLSRK